jgi:hypothetical protein
MSDSFAREHGCGGLLSTESQHNTDLQHTPTTEPQIVLAVVCCSALLTIIAPLLLFRPLAVIQTPHPPKTHRSTVLLAPITTLLTSQTPTLDLLVLSCAVW